MKRFTKSCYAVRDQRTGWSLVAKYIENDEAEFTRELEFAKLAVQHRIGVAVLPLSSYACLGGLLVTERWDLTLAQYIQSGLWGSYRSLSTLSREVTRAKRQLERLSVVHGDLIPRNVVCRLQRGRLRDVALIDFGLSFYTYEVGQPWPDLERLRLHVFDPNHWPYGTEFLAAPPSVKQLQRQPDLLDRPLLNLVEYLVASFTSK